MDAKLNSILLGKNAIATISIAREFIKIKCGERIPTVSDFEKQLHIARGTIQNAIATLKDNSAIVLEARGRNGTYLIMKDMRKLLSLSGLDSLIGSMPLPYSKRYEGLATGLIASSENQYDIPTSLSYMRGAKNRLGMLLADRYDFAIVSLFAAESFLKNRPNSIVIVKRFGQYSYLSEHVLVFHDDKHRLIHDGMRIGLDYSSIDHQNLTFDVCKNKNVEFVNMDYNQVISKIMSGDVDAAIWNKDEIVDKFINVNYQPLNIDIIDDTEAVLCASGDRPEIVSLLDEIIDVDIVLKNQNLVLRNKLTPNY